MVGSTGAPGEKDFNWDVANKVAELLRPYKEVRVVRADPTTPDITGDFELFLAIHYDADIYQKGGYMVDFPEPSTDGNTAESQRIAGILNEAYGRETGIVCHPERSNKNTRFYYMWQKLSAKTPCVLIECGVGQHHPDDYEVLFNQREKVVSGILKGILKAFNIVYEDMTTEQANILKFLTGKTEGDVREAFGALTDLPVKQKQIQTLQERVLVLESSQKGLEDRIVALESNIQADLKLITDWQQAVLTAKKALDNANKTNQDLSADRNQYKKWYEAKCDEIKKLDKMTAWQHIKYGISLLTVKK